MGFFRTLQGRAIKKTHGGNKNNKATDGVDLQHDVPKQNNITQGKGQRGNTREWDVMLLFIYLFILFLNEGEEETQERGVIKG